MKIGESIPDLQFFAYHDNQIKEFKFSDFRGKWLILFFYPGDFTFVCPTELEELADKYLDFQKEGAEILSVSTDSVYTHKAWHDTSKAVSKIKFPMVADPAGKLSRLFGVYLEEEGIALRGSFIIDPDGKLVAIEINNNDIGRNASELFRKLTACKFVREHPGNVCPASWKKGSKSLKPDLDLVGKI